MTVLIHLNGPSGVGKSTLAQLYVDEHPGVLDLDVDRVVAMVGGWQDDFFAALGPARHLALAMAEAHLASGHDVVMPQLVTSLEEAARFEAAAARAGAQYGEVALLAEPAVQRRRFRGNERVLPVDVHVLAQIEERGGDTLLERIHGHFDAYLADRPRALRITTDAQGPAATYRMLAAMLAP